MPFKGIKKYPHNLKLVLAEGMSTAIMTGGGAAFLIPFALFLGATKQEISFLIAFPALFAAFSQLGSYKLLDFYKERKLAVIVMVFFQSISWLLIGLIPFFFPTNQIFFLTIIYVIGSIFGSMGNPLWQSWLSSIVPKNILGEYFGTKNATTGLIVFLTLLTGGVVLRIVNPDYTLYVFSAIFIASFIGRFIATIFFSKIHDPKIVVQEEESIHFVNFISQLGKNNFGYFVLFGSLMTFAIALIGPFFSVYLLETVGLKSDYLTYTLIIGASQIAILISMPYWGKIIDSYGMIRTLRVTGLLASLYPILLIFVREPTGLMGIEVLSGIIFSGFNLCLASFIYESFPEEKIMKYAGYQATLFGIATFMGIIISGWIQSYELSINFLTNSFFVVCALAVIIRLTVYIMLIDKIKEVRKTKQIKNRTLIVNVLTFEPIRMLFFSSAFSLIELTENITITGIRKVTGIAKKSIKLTENYSNSASKLAENGLGNIEDLTKRNIKKVRKRIKTKNKKKLS